MGMPDHRRREECRLCRSRRLDTVLHLTPTPPANAFVSVAEVGVPQATHPLDLHRCEDCGHLQLLDIVNPEVLFRHYVYVSSTSPVMVRYLEEQCRSIIGRLGLRPGELVVEIGSNDGTLLRCFRRAGLRVLGVDPAANVVPATGEIETVVDFFSVEVARRIRETHGPARAVCAYNVCAHVDDLRGLVDGVRTLLAPDGQFVFEVGYLLDVYQKTLFDTIYHEHVDFHHVEPLQRFFADAGLALLHAEASDIQGGAVVGYAAPAGAAPDGTVMAMIANERAVGLHRADTFVRWGRAIDRRKTELTALLSGLRTRGQTLAAYGAPAKATTLMYHFGLDRSIIEYIVDDNPIKQGLFTPGLHVPVLAPQTLYERQPDYVVLLAWNFAESIVARHARYGQQGGRFILPLPDLKVV